MRKTALFLLTLGMFLFAGNSAFAANEISDFTEQKVFEFLTLRIQLKSEEDDVAINTIKEIRDKAIAELPEHAKDLEQEMRILESFYFMETYEHMFSPETRADLRKLMKEHMKANQALIESRKESQLSRWMYLVCGDVTTYYMTRSVAATIFYGFKVKGYYEMSIEKDPYITSGNLSFGSWMFYAPAPFGSSRKAEKCYEAALKGAKADGEKYLAFEFMSQYQFEKKNFELAEMYLQKAYDLNLGTKELDKIKACNKLGYSLFQYNRNRSGIDEKIPESEKEEED